MARPVNYHDFDEDFRSDNTFGGVRPQTHSVHSDVLGNIDNTLIAIGFVLAFLVLLSGVFAMDRIVFSEQASYPDAYVTAIPLDYE